MFNACTRYGNAIKQAFLKAKPNRFPYKPRPLFTEGEAATNFFSPLSLAAKLTRRVRVRSRARRLDQLLRVVRGRRRLRAVRRGRVRAVRSAVRLRSGRRRRRGVRVRALRLRIRRMLVIAPSTGAVFATIRVAVSIFLTLVSRPLLHR